jgi:hypothetical protein
MQNIFILYLVDTEKQLNSLILFNLKHINCCKKSRKNLKKACSRKTCIAEYEKSANII